MDNRPAPGGPRVHVAMTVKVCLSEIGPKMPFEIKKDICVEIRDPPGPLPRENRYFSSKAYWFWATHEIDIIASYLQVGLKEGIVRMWWGSVEIKSAKQFKAMYKAIYRFKYVVSPHLVHWGGLIYQEPEPRITKNIYCEKYEECIPFRGHIYKMPVKFVPQVLLGWAKRHYGVLTIDYVAGLINRYLRQVCAPDGACISHVHDGLVYSVKESQFKPPRLKYEVKAEEVNGWSFAGVLAPGDPPRHWGFMPNQPSDIILINKALTQSRTPEEAYGKIKHLCLFPEIFEKALGAGPAPGLVDLEYLIKNLGVENITDIYQLF